LILQNLDALEKDLESAPERGYYLVLGPEKYTRRQVIDLVRDRLIKADAAPFDYSLFSFRDTSLEKIFETAGTFPMLSKRRLVVATELEALPERDHDGLQKKIEDLPARSMLLLVAEEMDRRRKLYKYIQDNGCIVACPKLKGASLARWVESFAKRRGYQIPSPLVARIVDLAGSDLQSLAAELEKLFLYSGGEKRISERNVDDLVRNSRQHGIFELIDAIGKRDRGASLHSLANLLGMGEYPLRIVSMLARHSRQVLIVKESIKKGRSAGDACREAQVPHFVQDAFIRQARSVDLDIVQKMHATLHEIDRRLKSSSADARTLLEVFICNLV